MLFIVLQSVIQQHTQWHDTAVKFAILGSQVWVNENSWLIWQNITSLPALTLLLLLALSFLLLKTKIPSCLHATYQKDPLLNQPSVLSHLSVILRSAYFILLYARRFRFFWLLWLLHLLLHLQLFGESSDQLGLQSFRAQRAALQLFPQVIHLRVNTSR